MTGIDDLSHRIGGIEKDIQNLKGSLSQQSIALADLGKQMTAMSSNLESIARSTTETAEELKTCDRRITVLEQYKAKLIGIAIGVGAASGSAITWITKHFGTGS